MKTTIPRPRHALWLSFLLLSACGGGGGAADAPAVTAAVTLSSLGGGAAPTARDAILTNTYQKSGGAGAVAAEVTGGQCDGSPLTLTPTVTDSPTGGTVALAHAGGLLPPGGDCSYTLKVTAATASSGGALPSDSKSYRVVVDSADTDRLVVLSSTHNHSPVVYVRQDDNTFRLHVPKTDFTWTAGNCLLQRVPTSPNFRAVACRKIGQVDPNWYFLALSAADWTLSESATQVAKLGTVSSVPNQVYWADVNSLVANPTPQLAISVPTKGGAFTWGDDMVVRFAPTNGPSIQVANDLGTIKLTEAW